MAVSEHMMLLGQFLHSNGIALGGTAWKKQPVKKGIVYLIGGTIPTSLLVMVKNIFTPLVAIHFMECQLHIID